MLKKVQEQTQYQTHQSACQRGDHVHTSALKEARDKTNLNKYKLNTDLFILSNLLLSLAAVLSMSRVVWIKVLRHAEGM